MASNNPKPVNNYYINGNVIGSSLVFGDNNGSIATGDHIIMGDNDCTITLITTILSKEETELLRIYQLLNAKRCCQLLSMAFELEELESLELIPQKQVIEPEKCR
jgi:hypothetical protein